MTEILRMTNLKIEGFSNERWVPIVKGIDLTLNKGEVLGLIGESGAGKINHRVGLHGIRPQGILRLLQELAQS
jgi:peptide/nickel transport system ATP-binding protein